MKCLLSHVVFSEKVDFSLTESLERKFMNKIGLTKYILLSIFLKLRLCEAMERNVKSKY